MSNLFTFKLFLLITSKSCQWCICVSLQHSEEIFVTKKLSRLVTLCHDFVRNYNLHFIGLLAVIQWKQSELKIQANAEVLSLKWPAEVSQSPQTPILKCPQLYSNKKPMHSLVQKGFLSFLNYPSGGRFMTIGAFRYLKHLLGTTFTCSEYHLSACRVKLIFI